MRITPVLILCALSACTDDTSVLDVSVDGNPGLDAMADIAVSDAGNPDAVDAMADTGPSAAYREVPCIDHVGVPADGMRCGFVRVPQTRVRESNRDLELFFVRPEAADHDQPPVVVLAGGPGSSHGGFAARLSLPAELSEALGREVIYFDQRGVPLSIPDTLCPALDEASNPLAESVAFGDCNANWVADDIDLNAFNTLENAADIASIPAALGVAQIDLIAGSYATRLAAKVLERHPDAIRAAVLGGVDVPGVPELFPGTMPFNLLLAQAGADYAMRCATAERCQALIPQFEMSAVINALSERIDRDGMVEVAGIPMMSIQQLTGTLFPMMYVAQIRNMFFAAMYHAANDTNPVFYAHVGEGDPAAGAQFLRALLMAAQNAVFGGASGMSVATRCFDGDAGSCGLLPERIDDYPAEAFVTNEGSAHPVLMLSGALDPATPARNVDDYIQNFPNAQSSIIPCLGHDVSRISHRANGNCIIEQTRAFLDDPAAPLPACADALCDALPLVPDQAELRRVVNQYVEGFGE